MKTPLLLTAATAAALTLSACNKQTHAVANDTGNSDLSSMNPGQTAPVNAAQDAMGAAVGATSATIMGPRDTGAFVSNAGQSNMYEIDAANGLLWTVATGVVTYAEVVRRELRCFAIKQDAGCPRAFQCVLRIGRRFRRIAGQGHDAALALLLQPTRGFEAIAAVVAWAGGDPHGPRMRRQRERQLPRGLAGASHERVRRQRGSRAKFDHARAGAAEQRDGSGRGVDALDGRHLAMSGDRVSGFERGRRLWFTETRFLTAPGATA